MNKVSRIQAFVEFQRKSDSIAVKKVSPLFEKLVKNVKKEYKKFHQNREPKINNFEIVLKDVNESSNTAGYLQNQEIIDLFTSVKDTQELPFSITQEIQCQNDFNRAISFPSQHLLRTSYFVSNAFSREVFHQIQRQHKIWWMKFGASPGKYSISDQKTENFYKFVTIRSSVEESGFDVERLRLFSPKDCIKDKEILNKFLARMPNRKKEIIPDVIESTVDLQVASLALLLDAVNLSDDYTAFHRRSAPYQLALITSDTSKDLIDLARYIEVLVKETEPEIEILNEATSKEDPKTQFEKFDKVGIPYVISLDEKSLDSGLFKLRNRNTTLAETIHLSDVSKYLIKIFNSA
jgi:hypothetical protein